MGDLRSILLPALVFIVVMAIGGIIVVMRSGRQKELASRLHAGGSGPTRGPAESSGGVQLLQQIGSATSSKQSQKLTQGLVMAGFHSKTAPEVYLGVKALLLAAGLVAGLAVVIPLEKPLTTKLFVGMLIGAVFAFLPNVFVSMKRKSRTGEIRRTLPDATDLLEICVSAGMGLDTAWNSVTDEIRRVSDVLADEMALTNLEIQLGAARHAAMRNMARRTGASELSALVAVLVQSEKFGTSVAEALRTFAETMREERSSRAEESAEKMALKMLFPMILFIFPSVFIVLVGPAVIRLMEVF